MSEAEEAQPALPEVAPEEKENTLVQPEPTMEEPSNKIEHTSPPTEEVDETKIEEKPPQSKVQPDKVEEESNADIPVVYNRKAKRYKRGRAHTLLPDSPVFVQHADLRRTLVNGEAKDTGSSISHSGRSATRKLAQPIELVEKDDKTTGKVTFPTAPYATAEDVLNSLEEWKSSTPLLYAKLLWKYTPEALLQLALERSHPSFTVKEEEKMTIKREDVELPPPTE
ncbi:hypothetical protein ADEAN_000560000 [Angomonas deanei]|uniref:Uncharacterized protein n=1 Tax=Angomonas deanei TaxID=59799 RepID=A0A7G2CGV7_9TRYP|nr:hypothetical protein ADEAN_000560000 [Angomonas deanei]